MDTLALYIPLGHALGRVACFIVGCCWGRYVSFELFGIHFSFPNPVPLYTIFVNIIIFLFLRRIYENIYSNPATRARWRGSILAFYLMIYGITRIILEIFRKERNILFNLTQAQVVMMVCILAGLALFLIIKYKRGRHEEERSVISKEAELNKLFSLAGFLISYVSLFFIIYYITKGVQILPWPFKKAATVANAYAHIAYYLPIMSVPALSVIWLKKLNLPILEKFKWDKFSKVFFFCLAISIYYSIELLIIREPILKGFEFWPPIIVICILNAFSEEILYRLAIFSVFQWAGYSKLISNISQSLLYSINHFIVGGPLLGIFSIVYGYILGVTMDRNNSIIPCIICHFLIDIGCIGLPVLSY